ncbi:MAG: c-type cytochrome [Alphaproteobacteria bacterium]|jgi:cytochrome c
MRQLFIGCVLISFCAMTAPVYAAGDARQGKQIAARWCSSCHLVGSAGRSADGAPPFASLANNPAKTARYLKAWISNPHPPMPNFNLPRRTIDDLVAYIRSLKKAP